MNAGRIVDRIGDFLGVFAADDGPAGRDQPPILPPEIFVHIGTFLDPVTYARMANISSNMRAAMYDRGAMVRYVAANEKRIESLLHPFCDAAKVERFEVVLHKCRDAVNRPAALLRRLAGMWVMEGSLRPTGARISEAVPSMTRSFNFPAWFLGLVGAVFPERTFRAIDRGAFYFVCNHVFLVRGIPCEVIDMTMGYNILFVSHTNQFQSSLEIEIIGNGLGVFFISNDSMGYRVDCRSGNAVIDDPCVFLSRRVPATIVIDADGNVEVDNAFVHGYLFGGALGPMPPPQIFPGPHGLSRPRFPDFSEESSLSRGIGMQVAGYKDYVILSNQDTPTFRRSGRRLTAVPSSRDLLVFHRNGEQLIVPDAGHIEWRIGPHGIEAEDGLFIEFLFQKKRPSAKWYNFLTRISRFHEILQK